MRGGWPDGTRRVAAMRWFVTALALVSIALASLASGTASASSKGPVQGAAPSLRLFGAVHGVTVSQAALRVGAANLGLWVAAVGGNFELEVRRPGYGAWTTSQVDSVTGLALRSVPARFVAPAGGLKQFLSMRFVNARGRVVLQRLFTFCPSGATARVDDSGPPFATYPFSCGDGSQFFPFVRGTIWGINSGWAVQPSIGNSGAFPPGIPVDIPPCALRGFRRGGIRLKPGRYTVTASITSAYRHMFAIAAGQAFVTLRLHVTATPRPRGHRPGCGIAIATPAASNPGPVAARRGPLAAPTVAQPNPATMPNLVALPAWHVRTARSGGRDLLRFNATIWNAGPAPFSIEGYRVAGTNAMNAYEYFFDGAGDVVGRAPAGRMFYDNQRGHHHWHIRQLASYALLGPSGQVMRSHKQSFCIAPTNGVDLTVPDAAYGPAEFEGLGFGGSVCDEEDPAAIWLREELPVGWGDTYAQSVAGQAFDITKVANGSYRIQVRVNPLGLLHETSTTDDLAIRVVRLSGRPGARKVSVLAWHGING